VTANLLFSQTPYHTQQSDIARGMMEISVPNRSAVSKTNDDSSGDSRESFLNTFEHISKDHKSNKQMQGAGEGTSSTSSAYNSGDKFDAISCLAPAVETGISETTKQSEKDFDNAESQIPPALNLSEFISILEKLGLNDSAGGSSSVDKVDRILGNPEGLAALKTLFVRLGQDDPVSSGRMKTELNRLQHLIASVQTGNSTSHNAGVFLSELSERGSTEPLNWNQSAENSEGKSRSGNGAKADSIKLAVEARPVGLETSDNIRELRPLEKVHTDAFGLKDGWGTPGKTEPASQASLLNRLSSTICSGKQFSGESAPQNLSNTESSKRISREQQSTGETVRDNTVNTESSPISKMIHDAQLAKENHMKMNAAMIDELGEKVTKVDAATNDNGLLNSQNQTTEKAFEAASFSKQTEVSHDNLRTQTLDQIVKRAVIHLKNGQHEAKIDLKPDFLGHVRMQVTTVDQQVTVKILTEFSIVKDMIENNIHQLKADLQQQGLNVDKLEVSVSHDSDKYEDTRQKADQAKNRSRNLDQKTPENQKIETREQTGNSGLRTAGGSTVDYFA
jgi:flagellar hook-length control protein FliK